MNNRYYMLDLGHNGTIEIGAKVSARDAGAIRTSRFNSIDRAMRDIKACAGSPGRFALLDRESMTVIAVSGR
jgi:hypothetical protein